MTKGCDNTTSTKYPRGTSAKVYRSLRDRGLIVSQDQVQRVLNGDRSKNTLLGQIIIKKATELTDFNEAY